VLKERELLGEGAFSRVSEVVEDSSQRTFALKRMTKTAALQCPEHVYCEQHISKNTTNAFCIRQYASFKVGPHVVGSTASVPCILMSAGSVTRPSTSVANSC
jgi:cGMP-dependent protein kinase 2